MTAQPQPDPSDEARDSGEAGDGRDSAAHDRDDAADDRDTAADERDDAGDLRDDAADLRDLASGRRDAVAARRDTAADQRDADALLREEAHGQQLPHLVLADSSRHSAEARRDAALDRERASQDRVAGAEERDRAEADRSTSQADRDSGAVERGHAGDDRFTASSDRDASARDREDASLDGLTGAYVRGPGLLQLEREVDRAQRTSQELTIAFVDVDHLKAVNDSGGHAAGDRLLVRVADVLRKRLRPYDVVVRYGGDEFVCVLTGLGQGEAEARFALVNADLAGHGSVTVGVVTAEAHEGGEALVGRADAALYAKRAERPEL